MTFMIAKILPYIGIICAVELLLRIKLKETIACYLSILLQIKRVMSSQAISEIHKEKVIPIYAGRLFITSLLIPIKISIAFLPLIVILWLYGGTMTFVQTYFFDLFNLAGLTIVSIAYYFIRRTLHAKLFNT